jgi:bud site selection protein 31
MYYKYNKISREVYDYCISNKIIDAALIAKWKKVGYETLCSTYVINPKNFKFGTVSICRVPKKSIQSGTPVEDPTTGCLGCASGGIKNIFGNKYGQYLAAIQVAREERDLLLELEDVDDDSDNEEEVKEIVHTNEIVGAADGSSGEKPSIWAKANDVIENELINSNIGFKNNDKNFSGPPGKRTKNS